ncbi:uncharacterized protein PG986_004872 [Apiospora aurea]|uniref:Uncharacterized protein n=1 Tax=Apiospora aurea TaxID=335848 RepID=A0ABR1QFZ2_9PEZI
MAKLRPLKAAPRAGAHEAEASVDLSAASRKPDDRDTTGTTRFPRDFFPVVRSPSPVQSLRGFVVDFAQKAVEPSSDMTGHALRIPATSSQTMACQHNQGARAQVWLLQRQGLDGALHGLDVWRFQEAVQGVRDFVRRARGIQREVTPCFPPNILACAFQRSQYSWQKVGGEGRLDC